jgi:hypothetical protein
MVRWKWMYGLMMHFFSMRSKSQQDPFFLGWLHYIAIDAVSGTSRQDQRGGGGGGGGGARAGAPPRRATVPLHTFTHARNAAAIVLAGAHQGSSFWPFMSRCVLIKRASMIVAKKSVSY